MNSKKILVSPELWSYETRYRKQVIKKYKYCKVLHLAFPERDNFKKNYIHKFVSKLKLLKDLRVTDLNLQFFLIDYFKAMKSLHKTINQVNLPMARRYRVPGLLQKSIGRSLICMNKIDFSHEIRGTLKYIARVDQINLVLNEEVIQEAKMFFRLLQKAKRWSIKGSLDNANIFLKNMVRSLTFNTNIKLILNVTVSHKNGEFMERITHYNERLVQIDLDIMKQAIIPDLLGHLNPQNQQAVEVLNLTPLTNTNEIVESVPEVFEKASSYPKLKYLGLPVHFKDSNNISKVMSKFILPETLKTLAISFRNLELSNNDVIEKMVSAFSKLISLKNLDLYLEKIWKGKKNSPNLLLQELIKPLKNIRSLKISHEEHVPKMYDPVYEFSLTQFLMSLADNERLEQLQLAVYKFNLKTLEEPQKKISLNNLRSLEIDCDKETLGSSYHIFEMLNPKVIENIRIDFGDRHIVSNTEVIKIFEKLQNSSILSQINLKFNVTDTPDADVMIAFKNLIEFSPKLDKFNMTLEGLKINDQKIIDKIIEVLKLKHPIFKGNFKCWSHQITTQNSFPKFFRVNL